MIRKGLKAGQWTPNLEAMFKKKSEKKNKKEGGL